MQHVLACNAGGTYMELAAVLAAVRAALALGWLRRARCTRDSKRWMSTSSSLSSSFFTCNDTLSARAECWSVPVRREVGWGVWSRCVDPNPIATRQLHTQMPTLPNFKTCFLNQGPFLSSSTCTHFCSFAIFIIQGQCQDRDVQGYQGCSGIY